MILHELPLDKCFSTNVKSLAFTMPARSSGVLYSKEKHGRGRKLSRPIDPPSAGEGLDFRSDSGAILKHIPPRSEAEGCGICAKIA